MSKARPAKRKSASPRPVRRAAPKREGGREVSSPAEVIARVTYIEDEFGRVREGVNRRIHETQLRDRELDDRWAAQVQLRRDVIALQGRDPDTDTLPELGQMLRNAEQKLEHARIANNRLSAQFDADQKIIDRLKVANADLTGRCQQLQHAGEANLAKSQFAVLIRDLAEACRVSTGTSCTFDELLLIVEAQFDRGGDKATQITAQLGRCIASQDAEIEILRAKVYDLERASPSSVPRSVLREADAADGVTPGKHADWVDP